MNDRKREVQETARRRREQKAKQQRAIAGNHSVEDQGKALLSIAGELKKVMPEYLDFDPKSHDYDELFRRISIDPTEESIDEAREIIVGSVQQWIKGETDDRKKAKALEISGRTQRWLRKHVDEWTDFIPEIRKIKTPLSDDFKEMLRVLLAERAKQALEHETLGTLEDWAHWGLDGWEQDGEEEPTLTLQQVWDFVFRRGTEQEQDHRLRKFRKRVLAELKEELGLAPAWINSEWADSTSDIWPTKWMKGDWF